MDLVGVGGEEAFALEGLSEDMQSRESSADSSTRQPSPNIESVSSSLPLLGNAHSGEDLLPLLQSLESLEEDSPQRGSPDVILEEGERDAALVSSSPGVYGEVGSHRRSSALVADKLGDRLLWTADPHQTSTAAAGGGGVELTGNLDSFSVATSSVRGGRGGSSLSSSRAEESRLFGRGSLAGTAVGRDGGSASSRNASILLSPRARESLRVLLLSAPPDAAQEFHRSLRQLTSLSVGRNATSPQTDYSRLKGGGIKQTYLAQGASALRKQRARTGLPPFIGLLSILAFAAVALPLANRTKKISTEEALSSLGLSDRTYGIGPIVESPFAPSSVSSLPPPPHRTISVENATSSLNPRASASLQREASTPDSAVRLARRSAVLLSSSPSRGDSASCFTSCVRNSRESVKGGSSSSRASEKDSSSSRSLNVSEVADASRSAVAAVSAATTSGRGKGGKGGKGGGVVGGGRVGVGGSLGALGGTGGDVSSSSSTFAQSSQSANSSLASTPCESPPEAPHGGVKRPLSFYRELTEKLRSMIREETEPVGQRARRRSLPTSAALGASPEREAAILEADEEEEEEEETPLSEKPNDKGTAEEKVPVEAFESESESLEGELLEDPLSRFSVEEKESPINSRVASPSTMLQEPISSSSDFGSARRVSAPPPSPQMGDSAVHIPKWWKANEESRMAAIAPSPLVLVASEPSVSDPASSPLSSFTLSPQTSPRPRLGLRRVVREIVARVAGTFLAQLDEAEESAAALAHAVFSSDEEEEEEEDDEDEEEDRDQELRDQGAEDGSGSQVRSVLITRGRLRDQLLPLPLQPPPNTPTTSANSSSQPTPTIMPGEDEEELWIKAAKAEASRLQDSIAKAAKSVETRPSKRTQQQNQSPNELPEANSKEGQRLSASWRSNGLSSEKIAEAGGTSTSSESSASCASCRGDGVNAAGASSSETTPFSVSTPENRRRKKKRREFKEVAERRMIQRGPTEAGADSESDGEVFLSASRSTTTRGNIAKQSPFSETMQFSPPTATAVKSQVLHPSDWDSSSQDLTWTAEALAKMLRQRKVQATLDETAGTLSNLKSRIEQGKGNALRKPLSEADAQDHELLNR